MLKPWNFSRILWRNALAKRQSLSWNGKRHLIKYWKLGKRDTSRRCLIRKIFPSWNNVSDKNYSISNDRNNKFPCDIRKIEAFIVWLNKFEMNTEHACRYEKNCTFAGKNNWISHSTCVWLEQGVKRKIYHNSDSSREGEKAIVHNKRSKMAWKIYRERKSEWERPKSHHCRLLHIHGSLKQLSSPTTHISHAKLSFELSQPNFVWLA